MHLARGTKINVPKDHTVSRAYAQVLYTTFQGVNVAAFTQLYKFPWALTWHRTYLNAKILTAAIALKYTFTIVTN